MVVGDDDIQTQVTPVGYLFGGTDATINGDYDLGAPLDQFAQSILVEPIPFVNTVRDVGLGLSSQSRKSFYQEGSGCHPIGVEIAIDGDGLLLTDGLAETGDGFVHAPEAKGIILWPVAFQESLDLRGCAEASVIE